MPQLLLETSVVEPPTILWKSAQWPQLLLRFTKCGWNRRIYKDIDCATHIHSLTAMLPAHNRDRIRPLPSGSYATTTQPDSSGSDTEPETVTETELDTEIEDEVEPRFASGLRHPHIQPRPQPSHQPLTTTTSSSKRSGRIPLQRCDARVWTLQDLKVRSAFVCSRHD